MEYKIAPIVYETPPAASQNRPFEDKLSINGFKANTIIQPINTYINVDTILYFPVKKSFKIIPLKASPHTILNIIHPVLSPSAIIVKGVYVPAISTYIAA